MTSFEQKIANYNNWSIEYTNDVIFEYERFLLIKSNNIDSIPSDKIEKLWKFHILSMENYKNYCNQKFNKIINYDHTNEISSEEKLKKIINTIKIYKCMFGTVLYPDIWSFECKFTFADLDKISFFFETLPQPIFSQPIFSQPINSQPINSQPINSQPIFSQPIFSQQIFSQPQIPDYKSNRPVKDHIKIYIKYQNPNKHSQNMKLVDYKFLPNDSYQTIKQIISFEEQYPVKNIKITPHPEILNKNFLNIITNEINEYFLVSSLINYYDFIIAEIYENEIQTKNNF